MTQAIDATISAVGKPPRAVYRWRCPKCGRETKAPWLPVYQPELICEHDDGPWIMKRIANKGARTMDYDN